jgi:16S rRNA (uracil1498-N3)-methyltransferase
MPRFFDPQTLRQNQPAALDEAAAHHAIHVLRLREGTELTLFNGTGGEWLARIEKTGKQSVTVLPLAFLPDNREPSLKAHLWLPLIKGERLDWALQKATEMGVASIQLYISERTEVQLKGERLEKKLGQWQRILVSACEQCGLNRLPQIFPPVALSTLWPTACTPLKLIAHPDASSLSPNALDVSELTLLTGPEGGFSLAELEHARAKGFTPFSLGERVLRAETAPVALLAALQVMAGIS